MGARLSDRIDPWSYARAEKKQMTYSVTGIHHITACAGGAQQDIDFFTQIVGLRMVKQTVLMDGTIPIYHLYYVNMNAEPGSVMTTFPYGQEKGGARDRVQYLQPRFLFQKELWGSGSSTSTNTAWSMLEFRSASANGSFVFSTRLG
jgi:catechol 2,3-dioxygenase-like lactoylglutathione lyase family enzyme